jgi:hypothetical protein
MKFTKFWNLMGIQWALRVAVAVIELSGSPDSLLSLYPSMNPLNVFTS